MKIFQTLFLSLALTHIAFAETQTIQIHHSNFEFKTVKNQSEEGFERKDLELYRDHKKLFSHTLHYNTGDCSILTTEIDDYEVKGNQLIFYTYWAAGDGQGLWAFPYGVRKQVYAVDAKGTVKPVSALMYVEDIMGNPLEHDPQQEYLRFLNRPPKTAQQQKRLNDYIQVMQSRYHARFVHDQQREQLLKEVKSRLAKQIAVETKGWKEHFGAKVRM